MGMSRDKVYCLAAALVGFAVGSAIINATGDQPLHVMRPSVDMAVKPALASQMTRRAMMAGTLELGVAASHGAAVAEPAFLKDYPNRGTAEFRPAPMGIKTGVPGVPAKASDRVGAVGTDTPENFPPSFLPGTAVLAGVLIRIRELADYIDNKRKEGPVARTASRTMASRTVARRTVRR